MIAQRLDENHREGEEAHRANRAIQHQMRRDPEAISSQQQVPSNIPRQPKLPLQKRAEKQPRPCTAKGTLWEVLYLRYPATAGMRYLHGWRCSPGSSLRHGNTPSFLASAILGMIAYDASVMQELETRHGAGVPFFSSISPPLHLWTAQWCVAAWHNMREEKTKKGKSGTVEMTLAA